MRFISAEPVSDERVAFVHEYHALAVLLSRTLRRRDTSSVEQNPLLARRLLWIAAIIGDPLELAPFFTFWLELVDHLSVPAKDWWRIGRVLRSMRRLAYAARLPRKTLARLDEIEGFAGRQLWTELGLDRLDHLHALIEADVARFDDLTPDEKQRLAARLNSLQVAFRQERRATHQYLRPVAQIPRTRGRAPRNRRAQRRQPARRVAARRVQLDAGGSDGPGGADGDGSPDSGSLFRAYGLAPVRPGRPRGQTSTARSGERASTGSSGVPVGEGHIPRSPGSHRACAVPLSRPPRGPFREADEGGHRV
jgi:hypothetical protein